MERSDPIFLEIIKVLKKGFHCCQDMKKGALSVLKILLPKWGKLSQLVVIIIFTKSVSVRQFNVNRIVLYVELLYQYQN